MSGFAAPPAVRSVTARGWPGAETSRCQDLGRGLSALAVAVLAWVPDSPLSFCWGGGTSSNVQGILQSPHSGISPPEYQWGLGDHIISQ